jgi:tRNA modification GTPase
VLNKVDLLPPRLQRRLLHDAGGTRHYLDRRGAILPAARPACAVSAATGVGVEGLLDTLLDTMGARRLALQNDAVVAINHRHREVLLRAQAGLAQFAVDVQVGEPPEILAADLRGAVGALGELSGEQVSEEILDSIFARFCIGK